MRWAVEMDSPEKIQRWAIEMDSPDKVLTWAASMNSNKVMKWATTEMDSPEKIQKWAVVMDSPEKVLKWAVEMDTEVSVANSEVSIASYVRQTSDISDLSRSFASKSTCADRLSDDFSVVPQTVSAPVTLPSSPRIDRQDSTASYAGHEASISGYSDNSKQRHFEKCHFADELSDDFSTVPLTWQETAENALTALPRQWSEPILEDLSEETAQRDSQISETSWVHRQAPDTNRSAFGKFRPRAGTQTSESQVEV